MNPWLIIGGMGGTAALTASAFFYGQHIGKTDEREEWKTAQVEVVIGANENLAKHVKTLEDKAAKQEGNDIDVSQDIGAKTHTVETRIIQVPVEKVVTVEIPANCDGNDINISYDTLSLFNSWSTGGRLSEREPVTTTRDVPVVGAPKVSEDIAGNWPQ